MYRRNLHGGTTRPPLARPGNGFGRPLRPGPDARRGAERETLTVERFLELVTEGATERAIAAAPRTPADRKLDRTVN